MRPATHNTCMMLFSAQASKILTGYTNVTSDYDTHTSTTIKAPFQTDSLHPNPSVIPMV